MGDVQLWLYSPDGQQRVPGIVFTELSWTLEDHAFGVLKAKGPVGSFDTNLLERDARFILYRSPEPGASYYNEGETIWLLRYWSLYTLNGESLWQIEAYSLDYLFTGRIVEYYASIINDDDPDANVINPYTYKSGHADDVMRAIMRENFGPSILYQIPYRQITDLTIEADTGACGNIAPLSFGWRNVFDIFIDICNYDAEVNQEYLTFGMFATDGKSFVFRAMKGQRGAARSIIVSKETGNLDNPGIEFDYRNQATNVAVGGIGQGPWRTIGYAGHSTPPIPISRREKFVDGKNTDDAYTLMVQGHSTLWEYRYFRRFTAKFLDTNYARYGQNLFFGDKVTATYLGYQYTVRVNRVSGSWTVPQNGKGGEVLDIGLIGEMYDI